MASFDETGRIDRAPDARRSGGRVAKGVGLAVVAVLAWVATCAALEPVAVEPTAPGRAAIEQMPTGQSAPRQSVPSKDLAASLEENPFPPAAPADVGLTHEQLNALSSLTARWVEEDRIVGAEVLIVKDRRTVLHRTVGWSDREARIPMDRRSLFRLRSMTKPFTGTAALMLVEEGKLALDAPVSRYLPSWDNERSGRITVEELLTHRSGFEQGGWPAPARSFTDLRGLVDTTGAAGPQHPPGERFRYSDANSFTLGALVTELSGMPVERFIEIRILAPLGLDDTHIGVPPGAPWADRVHPTYMRDDGGRWTQYWTPADGEDVFPYFRASGGLLSSALDQARWLVAWMDGTRLEGGGRLLSEETVARALISRGGEEDGGYGYHWEILGTDPLAFGHGGSDGTLGLAVPEEDLIVIYFTQSRGSGTIDEWKEAVRGLWDGRGAASGTGREILGVVTIHEGLETQCRKLRRCCGRSRSVLAATSMGVVSNRGVARDGDRDDVLGLPFLLATSGMTL